PVGLASAQQGATQVERGAANEWSEPTAARPGGPGPDPYADEDGQQYAGEEESGGGRSRPGRGEQPRYAIPQGSEPTGARPGSDHGPGGGDQHQPGEHDCRPW